LKFYHLERDREIFEILPFTNYHLPFINYNLPFTLTPYKKIFNKKFQNLILLFLTTKKIPLEREGGRERERFLKFYHLPITIYHLPITIY